LGGKKISQKGKVGDKPKRAKLPTGYEKLDGESRRKVLGALKRGSRRGETQLSPPKGPEEERIYGRRSYMASYYELDRER